MRRGLADPAAARAFLDADGALHDPLSLGDMETACSVIEATIAAGGRIVVHGDYDADGICATALAVEALRELGGDVAWHLPSRFVEGYGLAVETVDAVADAGASLLVTVDCGISAAPAVARARERGLQVVVTDHHRPGDELPDAPLVAVRGPHADSYPFAELCGTGVAFKLAHALWLRRGHEGDGLPPALEKLLDLVALATVTDVVPLVDENRALVRAGLRVLARGERIGLAALMHVAGVDRARLRSSDLGFRLGPRLNAAGRMGHPGGALELLLTRDGAVAERLAGELEQLNRERQAVEDGIRRAAVTAVDADPATETARVIVVAGEGWHEGVVGIVASRLVERYRRPAVVLSVDGDVVRGSGRSIPAYDLHAGLTACAAHLERYGGHRAAAGMSLAAGDLAAFTEALRAHAAEALDEADLRRPPVADAVVGVPELTLDLARELARLEPHGLGNPAVDLLLPAVELTAVETMGEGRHLRLQVAGGGARCGGVAFGRGQDADGLRAPGRRDVVCRLEINEWNGRTVQRINLRNALAPAPALPDEDGWADRPALPAGELVPLPAAVAADGPVVHDLRGAGLAMATIARLLAASESVLVVVADVARRRALFTGPLAPARYGAEGPVRFSARCDGGVLAARAQRLGAGTLAVADHWALARVAALRNGARHVVVLDPPAHADEAAVLAALPAAVDLHLVWGPREAALAQSVVEAAALRPVMVALWRALAAAGECDVATLIAAAELRDPPPSADTLSHALDALVEAGVATRAEGIVVAGSPDGKADLAAAPAYARHEARRAECLAFLAGSYPVPGSRRVPGSASAGSGQA